MHISSLRMHTTSHTRPCLGTHLHVLQSLSWLCCCRRGCTGRSHKPQACISSPEVRAEGRAARRGASGRLIRRRGQRRRPVAARAGRRGVGRRRGGSGRGFGGGCAHMYPSGNEAEPCVGGSHDTSGEIIAAVVTVRVRPPGLPEEACRQPAGRARRGPPEQVRRAARARHGHAPVRAERSSGGGGSSCRGGGPWTITQGALDTLSAGQLHERLGLWVVQECCCSPEMLSERGGGNPLLPSPSVPVVWWRRRSPYSRHTQKGSVSMLSRGHSRCITHVLGLFPRDAWLLTGVLSAGACCACRERFPLFFSRTARRHTRPRARRRRGTHRRAQNPFRSSRSSGASEGSIQLPLI